VIDEVDAVFRRCSSGEDSEGSNKSECGESNFGKLDGIKAINNVLMVGIRSRWELLDETLLRPGRLEVQIEIPLPDRESWREILQIHFDALRKKSRLSVRLMEYLIVDHGAMFQNRKKQRTAMAIRLIRWFEDESVKHSSVPSKLFGIKLLRLFDHHTIWLQILQPVGFPERILLD
jgi:vesicle-fusing ATPase